MGGNPSIRESAMTTQTINSPLQDSFFGTDDFGNGCDNLQLIANALQTKTKSNAKKSFKNGLEEITLIKVFVDETIPEVNHYQFQINGTEAMVTLSTFIENKDGSLKSYLNLKLHDEYLTRSTLIEALRISQKTQQKLSLSQLGLVCTEIWRFYVRLKLTCQYEWLRP